MNCFLRKLLRYYMIPKGPLAKTEGAAEPAITSANSFLHDSGNSPGPYIVFRDWRSLSLSETWVI